MLNKLRTRYGIKFLYFHLKRVVEAII